MISFQNKQKTDGQVFTPCNIVCCMLDFIGYFGPTILDKHIMENSCGDGAFLVQIVERYCSEFLKTNNNIPALKHNLEFFIHGIEKDEKVFNDCIRNLDNIAEKYGLIGVKWDVANDDALVIYKRYNSTCDFVVGNPPYVRVHNLNDSYDIAKRNFSFCQLGMTDIYLVFFEIGLSMLKNNGKMCLVTPSSWLKSKAGQIFRGYIKFFKNLHKAIDLQHFQPFKANTYTLISLFVKNSPADFLDYFTLDESLKPKFVDAISYLDFFIDGKIFLNSKNELNRIKNIEQHCKHVKNGAITVKNGFATLSDDVFIGDFEFSNFVIDVMKASTGKRSKCIFPYDVLGNALNFNQIKSKCSSLSEYLISKKEILENRSLQDKNDWFLFGRTQAIKDVFKKKICINNIIKDLRSIKISELNNGEGVYSGLYILSDFSFETIQRLILSDEFLDYVKSLKNFKSGGYYTFSSRDLEKFLVYKLIERNKNEFSLFANNKAVS